MTAEGPAATPRPDAGGGWSLTEVDQLVAFVAGGQGLDATLERIAAVVERLAPSTLCSIELVDADGRHLRHGAAPSLPPDYRALVEGLEIGPGAGACGTAVHRRAPVIVTDIETDPLFAPYLAMARALGLRACWSLPIFDDHDSVIATFALYHRVPCQPSAAEWRMVASMGSFVRLALLQHRREQALRLARDEAEAANHAKSMFLAHMSHELRTPLNAILGFSEMIREMMLGPLNPRYREYAADIHTAGHHLLDLAKIEVGKLELFEETVFLPDLIGGCQLLVREAAERAGVTVAATVPPEIPLLRADRLRFKQILLNLLSNAIKFTPSGGEVRVAALVTDRGDFRLTVSDNGVGMRPEDIPVALSSFGQVEGGLHRRREGTGLGLPLARTFVELHGGTLRVSSEVGIGTSVEVTLPGERLLSGRSGDHPDRS